MEGFLPRYQNICKNPDLPNPTDKYSKFFRAHKHK